MNIQVISNIVEVAKKENLLLKIKYTDSNGKVTSRLIETLDVNPSKGYFKSWCRKRNKFRTFKFTNISEVKITDKKFRPLEV